MPDGADGKVTSVECPSVQRFDVFNHALRCERVKLPRVTRNVGTAGEEDSEAGVSETRDHRHPNFPSDHGGTIGPGFIRIVKMEKLGAGQAYFQKPA